MPLRRRKGISWKFELTLHGTHREVVAAGPFFVAGVDEAGRGCLAGPVYAAATILPVGFSHPDLNDSKQMSRDKREEVAQILRNHPDIFWSEASATPGEIDELNIYQAAHLAMSRAVRGLAQVPGLCLIDGKAKPKALGDFPLLTIIDGDALCPSIAAASVLAKTSRDAAMHELDRLYPCYGFAQHKGYATQEHCHALTRHGPSPVHRHSFRPVREAARS